VSWREDGGIVHGDDETRRQNIYFEYEITKEQRERKEYQQCALTFGMIGGVNVPFFNPSQLKPSNHLKDTINVMFYYTVFLTFINK